jgi:peptidyl-prolyl cis-trans isomerase D
MIRFLQQENKFTKLIFWAIIVVVAGFMVITLIPGIFSGGGPSDGSATYATVRNGGYFGRYLTVNSEVSTQQVQRVASRMLQQQKLPDMLMPYAMRRASDSLVQEAVLSYEADRLGLKVSDQALREELQKGSFAEYIFPNGQFVGDDRYANFVSMAFNMSVAEFENTLKREMAISRLQQMVTSGVTVSDADVRKEYMEQGTKVKFDYAFFTQDDVSKQINPTDAELQSFFQSHAKQYANAVPETRKLQYVALDPNAVPGGNVQPSDTELRAYYQAHLDQYQLKDQVKVRHILIKVPQGADAATDAAAKKKAEDIRKQILAGGDFAKLAQENSDDPGSKAQGGELGFIQPGKTVPEFDKVAFSLQPGQTSEVIKTEFGYHILQVEEKQSAHTVPFEQVKAQIMPLVARDMQMKAAKAAAQKIADQAKSEGLDKAAAANHLQVQTTDYLAHNGTVPGIPDGAPMLTGAFAAKQGAAPQVVSTGETFAVYTVADIKAAHAPSFEEYKSHILDDYRAAQAPALLNQKAQELAAQAKAGNLQQAAKETGATFKTSDLVDRNAAVPDIGSISDNASAIFALSQGQVGGPFTSARSAFVVKIDEKQEPTAQDLATHFQETKDKLLNDKRERVFAVFVGNLMDRYKTEKRIMLTKQATTAGSPFNQPS